MTTGAEELWFLRLSFLKGAEKMKTIEIGGRTIPLMFTMDDLATFSEEVGLVSDMKHLLTESDNPHQVRNLIKTIRICGNSGLIEEGKEPDLTDKWVGRHLKPYSFIDIMMTIVDVLNDDSETENKEDEKPGTVHDVVKEEIEKKKEKGN